MSESMLEMAARHVECANRCNTSYDTSASDIWSVGETDVLVCQGDDEIVDLAIRGTEFSNSAFRGNFSSEGIRNVRDTLRNIRAYPRFRGLPYWAHAGFKRSAEYWHTVFAESLKRAVGGRALRIQGHSQGAGVAPHLVFLLAGQQYRIIETVLFAEPKSFMFGSEQFYYDLNIPTYSYLYANDWIRFAPPWGETAVPRTYLEPKGGVSFGAHSIDNYAQALVDTI